MSNPVYYHLSAIPGFNELLLQDNKNNNSSQSCLNKTSSSEYQVIRYDKHYLCQESIPMYGLCRSVIVNESNRVVGFSPPKAVSAQAFMEDNTEAQAEEFVEGTMINVFYDGTWQIATRNTVGAETSFYKTTTPKTFREMFEEALTVCGLTLDIHLEKKFSYSFVLQHPCNRIVVPFARPQLYLVAVYEIEHRAVSDIWVRSHALSDFHHLPVSFPEVYPFESYTALIDRFGSMNTHYSTVGVILRNPFTGVRSKIRNPVYEQVRSLRGNQPKLQYQYLALRKEGKVKDFLTYYPESKQECSQFRDQVHLFTNTLYANYIQCYVKKSKPLKEFGEQYRTHMFHLHELYRNELKSNQQWITHIVVQSYVNSLHPSLLMHSLNFASRRNAVDTIVAEEQEATTC
jgi:hypothetical protein